MIVVQMSYNGVKCDNLIKKGNKRGLVVKINITPCFTEIFVRHDRGVT